MVPIERFQPYGTSRAHTTGYTNAEAEPTTLAPPSIARVASPTQQPSGGISETTAVAEKQHNNIEEDKIPVSNFYRSHIPHVAEQSFGVRRRRGLGIPVATANRGTTALKCGRKLPYYSSGYGSNPATGNPKASARLWAVSTHSCI